MIRISDKTWLNKSAIEGINVKDNKVHIFNGDGGAWKIEEKYLTDALTGLNINVGDVLAQLGRDKHEG